MRGMFEKVAAHIREKERIIPLLFFCLLFGALLLGDGKQGVVEIYSGSVVLACWGVFSLFGFTYKRMPRHLLYPMIGMALVSIVSMTQSDSVGFSLSWLVRFACGYAIYRIFYSLASKRLAKTYIIGTCALVCGAIVFSLFSFTFSWFRMLLPSMNLIDVRHGHSHLADLLVYVAPAVVFFGTLFSGASTKTKTVVLVGFVLALFFTFARGAWILLVLYCVFLMGSMVIAHNPNRFRRSAFMFFYVGACVCGGILVISRVFPSAFIDKQTTQLTTVSSRVEYWRQAVETAKERPIFGSGPGTFSLESQRFQSTKGKSSWFAHSIIMQTLAETGVVGASTFLWLIIAHAAFWLQKKPLYSDVSHHLLLHGTALLFFYSIFEFVLDYQVVWLLFWGGAGVLTGARVAHPLASPETKQAPFFSLGYIFVYYVLWVIGSLTATAFSKADVAYLFSPFDAGNALLALVKIHKAHNPELVIQTAQLFHARNPNILIEISRAQRKLHKTHEANETIKGGAELYPIVDEVQTEYIMSLLKDHEYAQIALWIQEESPRLFYSDAKYTRGDLEISPEIIEKVSEHIPALFNRKISPHIRYSRFFYNAGLQYLDTNPQKTAALWALANNLQPDLSYLWVERAALEKYTFVNQEGADMILRTCQQNNFAEKHCSWLIRIGHIPSVGSHVMNINE